ncbi:MAG: adenylate/guanylate cyclase domain-containing protein [Archangium sp.]|nr:adenylate/guanylate cyclase domain-containing protein [Archangium sp.]
MSGEKSATIAQIRLDQEHDEAQVRAQSALIGERAVAITRLAVMTLIGISTGVLDRFADVPTPASPLRGVVVGLYLAFCIGVVVMTQRVKKGDPKLALWLVGSYIFIDAAFFLFHAWNDQRLGIPGRPEIITVTFALLVCFSVARSRLIHVVLSTAVSIASVATVALIQGWAHPVWTAFACSCLLALGLLIGFTNLRVRAMFVDIRRRENLSRFLPRQVVERVLASGGAALEPVQREVTILFSDIRSFTSMSETMAPREVLEFLDEYFGHMGQIVRGHEGMLNKFLGDGMLAVWGVPDQQEDHAVRAVRAALDMRKKLVELNGYRVREGRAEIRIGIGIHTGVVAAGMLGGADQREYTVIGDAVNLASRIETLTKALGTDLLVSESTFAKCGGKFEGTRVGEEKVKGRDAGVVVFTIASR